MAIQLNKAFGVIDILNIYNNYIYLDLIYTITEHMNY